MKHVEVLALIALAGTTTTTGAQDTLDPFRVDPTPIAALAERVRNGDLPNVHAVLVVRNGELVVEEYFGGWTADRQHYTASVSKSIGSLLLGAAVQLEILDGVADGVLDRPVAKMFPGYRDLIEQDAAKAGLLFRHVLSMTAGLEWDESDPYDDARNDCNRAEVSEDPVAFVLARAVVEEPGSRFEYNGGLSMMVSHLLAERSGVTAAEFAEEVLFGPLRIEDYTWETLPSGLTDTCGGLHLRPRDMAKLGLLALNGGRWEGRQIVSADWLRESTRRHTATDDGPDYGLQWWNGSLFVRGTEIHTYFASGHGGQKIFVVPSLDAVVVVTQQVFDNPAAQLNNLGIMTTYVLPALLPPVPPDAVPAMAAVVERPERYVGEYLSERPGDGLVIELDGGSLHVVTPDSDRIELVPAGENEFVCVLQGVLEVPVRFSESEGGKIVGLELRYGFRAITFQRRE